MRVAKRGAKLPQTARAQAHSRPVSVSVQHAHSIVLTETEWLLYSFASVKRRKIKHIWQKATTAKGSQFPYRSTKGLGSTLHDVEKLHCEALIKLCSMKATAQAWVLKRKREKLLGLRGRVALCDLRPGSVCSAQRDGLPPAKPSLFWWNELTALCSCLAAPGPRCIYCSDYIRTRTWHGWVLCPHRNSETLFDAAPLVGCVSTPTMRRPARRPWERK